MGSIYEIMHHYSLKEIAQFRTIRVERKKKEEKENQERQKQEEKERLRKEQQMNRKMKYRR